METGGDESADGRLYRPLKIQVGIFYRIFVCVGEGYFFLNIKVEGEPFRKRSRIYGRGGSRDGKRSKSISYI